MAGMQKVKTAIGERDALAIAFSTGDDENQVVLRYHLAHLRLLSRLARRIHCAREHSFYHAARRPCLEGLACR
jgi:hypothetical protein